MALAVFFIAVFGFYGGLDSIPSFQEWQLQLLTLTILIPFILYCILTEAGRWQGTLGKHLMKFHVVAKNGGKASVWQIILRNIIKFVPWQFAHTVVTHGFAVDWQTGLLDNILLWAADIIPVIWLLFVLIQKQHRGLHDMVGQTCVVPDAPLSR
jgi:uncharacterized RDD family membrane protein YckC